MKRTLLILLYLISIFDVNAQFAENNALYVSTELNSGNYRAGADINLNYVYKDTYSLKIGYSGNIRKPVTQPNDYIPSLFEVFFFWLETPLDQMENYQLALGRIYNLNERGTVRANLSIGLSYTRIIEPNNWERNGGMVLVSNYSWNYEEIKTVSLILNPKIEFPFSHFYGFTVSPLFIINKHRAFYGIGIGQMIGLLKKRVK